MKKVVRIIGDKRDLEELLRDHGAVIVVCWLRECDMSRWLVTALEEFAEENDGCIAVGELDVEETDLWQSYDVAETPTLLFFRGGQLVMREVVAVPVEDLQRLRSQVAAAKGTWKDYFANDNPSRALAA